MKTYQVSVKFIAWAHYSIDADSAEAAEKQAWDQIQADPYLALGYGDWTMDSIEEVAA